MAGRSIGIIVLLWLAGFAGDVAAAQLKENAQYDVTGLWMGAVLDGTAIEPAEDDVQPGEVEIEGRITALDLQKKVLQIGPVTVEWSESTRFIAIQPAALKITGSIEIEARIVAPRRVRATVIERAPAAAEPNYFRVMGAVTNVKENADGSVRFEVIGVPVLLPGDIYRELRRARVDDDEEDEETTGTSLRIFGEYEAKLDYQGNFALDERVKDDVLHLDQEFQLRLFYPHNDRVSVLIEAEVFAEHEVYSERRGRKSEAALDRGEIWIRFNELFGRNLALKVGRQSFEEPRRWWWDEELDAVGVRYRHNPWLFQLGVSQELFPTSTSENFIDPENEGVLRVLGRIDWRFSKNHRLGLFFLHQNDSSRTPSQGALVRAEREDPSDARLWFGGLRAMGNATVAGYGDFSYWADAAMVMGNEKLLELEGEGGGRKRVIARRNRRVQGWAVDAGGRLASQLPGRPVFTLGYALGSGDKDPESGADRAFRQTGLQSNDEEFRTYGELLRPELSNLGVAVLSVQFPILSQSHIEFAYRHFRQHYAVPFLRDGRIETDPNGRSKEIGQEWMVYSAIKEWQNVELELVGAAFRAGHAYGALSGKRAYSLFTKVTFDF